MYDDSGSDDMEERFRAAAVDAIGAGYSAIDSSAAWQELVDGRASVVDEFTTPGWLFLIVGNGSTRRLTRRALEIVEEVLLGTEPKVVSIERRLSASTVSGSLKQAFETLGLRCKPSKAPLLLVTLVHAAKGRSQFDAGRTARFEHLGTSYRVLGMPSPNQVFDRVLSPAERCVLRMRLEGKSHAEIAARRRTSPRTVANQIASAFHRLGVSRRSDLMEWLIAPNHGQLEAPESSRRPSSRRPPAGRARRNAANESHDLFTQ